MYYVKLPREFNNSMERLIIVIYDGNEYFNLSFVRHLNAVCENSKSIAKNSKN